MVSKAKRQSNFFTIPTLDGACGNLARKFHFFLERIKIIKVLHLNFMHKSVFKNFEFSQKNDFLEKLFLEWSSWLSQKLRLFANTWIIFPKFPLHINNFFVVWMDFNPKNVLIGQIVLRILIPCNFVFYSSWIKLAARRRN